MTDGPPIFRDAPEVKITIEGDPFRTPWKLVLDLPGFPPILAECLVIMDATADGDPHLRVVWKGREHEPDIRAMFEGAITEYIRGLIPDDHDLTPMPTA